MSADRAEFEAVLDAMWRGDLGGKAQVAAIFDRIVGERDEARAQLADTIDRSERYLDERDAAVERLAQLNGLEDQYGDTIDGLRDEITTLRAERDAVVARAEKADGLVAGMQDRALHGDMAYAEHERLRAEVAALTAELAGLNETERLNGMQHSIDTLMADNERLRVALRDIRGFDDPWGHRGHEPSEVGHECRLCWIMKTVTAALAPRATP